MSDFGILMLAVDEYPDPPGKLPSSHSAARLAKILDARGGTIVQRIVATSRAEILDTLDAWAQADSPRPSSSILYLVGHGTDNTLEHAFLVPADSGTAEISTASLAPRLQKDWTRRRDDRTSWTLFVLDCCGANIGVVNLEVALSQHAPTRPGRVALWPTARRGASHSGCFVDAFERALETFNENDASIPLNEVFRRILPELGDLEPLGFLPDTAVLENPLYSPTSVVMTVDAHAELHRVVSGLPVQVRSHFLNKAQGAESGELAWYFKGREEEISALSTWLRDDSRGMRVVTGPPGSGKSAVLGYLTVLADDELVDAYAATDLVPDIKAWHRPPAAVFDAIVHLTGKTLNEVLNSVREQTIARHHDEVATDTVRRATTDDLTAIVPGGLIGQLRLLEQPVTVLTDALDEAQEPIEIARFLRMLADSGVARVLVGTRRSMMEGPDQPADSVEPELLDALEARDEDLIIIDNDQEACYKYVKARLGANGSPYRGQRDVIQALAKRIASLGQPFLFARLATSELLARPAMSPDSDQLEMLEYGHGGVFAAAVARIADQDPVAATMLEALAYGRGRGLPQSGGIWVAVARTRKGAVTIPETAVQQTLSAAAPYITLDAEGGQATYRLAHQTFIEQFRGDYFDDFLYKKSFAIGPALLQLVKDSGGWANANYYLVRHLPGHLDGIGNYDDFSSLTTDAGWLRRAMEMLGVDGIVHAIAEGGLTLNTTAYIVQKALRRSRVALSRDPGQLAGQMMARLRYIQQPRLAGLGTALAAENPDTMLLMRHGVMDWSADLDTTYGLVGKVRALAFGYLDERLLLAIGVEKKIHLWNPLLGSGEGKVIDNDGRRVTALAFAKMDGRSVLVVASAYDEQMIVVRDMHSGDQVGYSIEVDRYVDSLAVGLLDRQIAIVASGDGGITAWDALTKALIKPLAESLREGRLHSVSVWEGRIVAHVTRDTDEGSGTFVVDVATGEEIFSDPMYLEGDLRLVASFAARQEFIVSGCIDGQTVVTWAPKEKRELHRFDVDRAHEPRALAIAETDQLPPSKVVAWAPDVAATTLVELRQVDEPKKKAAEQSSFAAHAPWRSGRRIEAVFKTDDGILAALVDSPLELYDLTSAGHGAPINARPEAETVAFALTGRHRTGAVFAVDNDRCSSTLANAPYDQLRSDLPSKAPLDLDKPSTWPQTAKCWGLVDGRPVILTGSIDGAVWLWDVASRERIAGPLTTVPPDSLAMGWSYGLMKAGPTPVVSVALDQLPQHGDVVAVVHNGRVRLRSIPDGRELPTPADGASVVTSVALGHVLDEVVLVTGSMGGVVIVWGLQTNSRIAALTLDRGVDQVWVVRGEDTVAARARDEIYVLDVVRGTESI